MDDISRELPPDETGATPVSERQKGPQELQRFGRGSVGEDTDVEPQFGDRIAAVGEHVLADRNRAVDMVAGNQPREDGDPVDDSEPLPGQPEPLRDDPEPLRDEAPVDPSAEESRDEAAEPDQPEAGQPTDADALAELGPEEEGAIDVDAAQAAVAAEAGTAELDSVDDLADAELGEDGLPVVPELRDATDVARMIYVLMMTSREGMTVFRLAQACNTSQKLVEEALVVLHEQLQGLGLPVELARTGDTVRWMSRAVAFPYLQRLRGVKKLEKLSPAALETLAVIAYQQPVMRSEIEAIRGVKAGPMLRALLQHKLVKVAGRADVPGRPLQYGTTQQFLERFGLTSLQELPSVKEWKNLG